eukprot:jgi/Phyca11/16518/fgenesh1_pg.PHYCAscaffold_20_\
MIRFEMMLERRPGYYVTNVAIPAGIITYLCFISYAPLADGSLMDTGDRVQIVLTLLLTAVTFKNMAASLTPHLVLYGSGPENSLLAISGGFFTIVWALYVTGHRDDEYDEYVNCQSVATFSSVIYQTLPAVVILSLPGSGLRAFEPFKREETSSKSKRMCVSPAIALFIAKFAYN